MRTVKYLSPLPWRFPIGFALLAVMVFAAWLLGLTGQDLQAETDSTAPIVVNQPISIEGSEVIRADFPLECEATGTLQPRRQVVLGFQLGGEVVWRGIEEGQRISAGEPILRLGDAALRLELYEAEAELLKVRASHAVAFATRNREQAGPFGATPREATEPEDEYSKAQRLFDQGLISERDLERAHRRTETSRLLKGHHREDVQAATIGVTQAELRVERARLALEHTSLASPFAGRIADLEVEVGQQVTAGAACCLLLDDSQLEVEVAVLEADVIRLRPGAPAKVRVPALDDRLFAGHVHTINPRVDRESGTGRVTVLIDNPDGLLMPGLFAVVSLEVGRLEDRLQLPSSSILERQGRELVFRIEDARALWTYVETGARSRGFVEILDGLNEGDLVAIGNHFALAHETPVRILSGGGRS